MTGHGVSHRAPATHTRRERVTYVGELTSTSASNHSHGPGQLCGNDSTRPTNPTNPTPAQLQNGQRLQSQGQEGPQDMTEISIHITDTPKISGPPRGTVSLSGSNMHALQRLSRLPGAPAIIHANSRASQSISMHIARQSCPKRQQDLTEQQLCQSASHFHDADNRT